MPSSLSLNLNFQDVMKRILNILALWGIANISNLAYAQGGAEVPASVNILVIVAYIAIGLAAVLAIFLPIVTNPDPKKLAKTGIGILALGVVFLIGWAIAGSDVPAQLAERFGVTAGSIKLYGGVIITFYILLAVAFLSIIVTEVLRILR
jgi:hypothetical protein